MFTYKPSPKSRMSLVSGPCAKCVTRSLRTILYSRSTSSISTSTTRRLTSSWASWGHVQSVTRPAPVKVNSDFTYPYIATYPFHVTSAQAPSAKSRYNSSEYSCCVCSSLRLQETKEFAVRESLFWVTYRFWLFMSRLYTKVKLFLSSHLNKTRNTSQRHRLSIASKFECKSIW